MIKAYEYGKSKNGWYCYFNMNGMIDGLNAVTYKEFVRRCKLCGVILKGARRIDK